MGGKKTRTPAGTRRDAHRRERIRQALEHRISGATYGDIATQMRISRSTAYTYVQDALKEITREPAEQVRTLELQRYDALLTAHWATALHGDQAATDTCLKIMGRIELLHGVKPPTESDDTRRTSSLLATIAANAATLATTHTQE
ncbi:hypothetical protein [Actinomyces sp. HMT897]|uniref:hypothetical protein n=1 Tax=Actinomyces sp. HMT897 TaxID=2789424 RepID=UPI00190CFAAC|nr:hypothetical protein [Actinomyces sp. HMT897]QQO78153.1 hypothetical protein JJJ15_01955 [Actinomyces sp. HMT897]DAR87812.1 MAG TPA: Transcriptional regulator, TetR family like regulator, isovalerate, regulation.7A [Caudoviricetes sp.]